MSAKSISAKSFLILISLIICTQANSQITSRVNVLELIDLYYGNLDTRGTALCINNMNEFVLAGTVATGFAGPYDGSALLTRWSNAGALLQQASANYVGFPSRVNGIISYAGNNYAVVGNTNGQGPNGGIVQNAYFSLFDSNFTNQMSLHIFNTSTNSYATGVIEVSPGIFIISGIFTINNTLRPGLIKVSVTGNIISAVSLNVPAMYYDRFRLKKESNGTLTAQGLRNTVVVFDTSMNVVNQSNFTCAAITCCLRPSSNGGYISVSSDGAVGGTAITVATMDSNFNPIQNSIRFHDPTYKLEPIDVFQNPSGSISLYMIALNVTNQSNSLVLVVLDSACQIISMHNYTDSSVPAAYSEFNFMDVIQGTNGRFYAAGATQSNPISGSLNITLAILDAGTGCWSGTFPNPVISAASTFSTTPIQLNAMSTVNSSYSIAVYPQNGTQYSKCLTTSIDEFPESEPSVSVFPTVTSDLLNIELQGPVTMWTARFFDLTGREMFEMNLSESGSYDVHSLQSGMYMVVFTAGDALETKYVIKL